MQVPRILKASVNPVPRPLLMGMIERTLLPLLGAAAAVGQPGATVTPRNHHMDATFNAQGYPRGGGGPPLPDMFSNISSTFAKLLGSATVEEEHYVL